MDFEVQSTEKPRGRWPFLLIGAAVVVVLVVLFSWVSRQTGRQSPGQARLPFGPAEQAYAPNVKFENLKMSRFANMLNQDVTYLAGEVVNQGNRTIADLQVTVEFRNQQNQVVLREARRLLGFEPVPIPPGGREAFRIGFDKVPSDWNVHYPNIQVTGLVLH